MKSRFGIPIGLLLVAGLFACKSDSTSPDGGDKGSLLVSLSTSSLDLELGGNASVTITITRVGTFDGPVTLSVEGAPSSVTTTLSPTSLAPSSTTGSLLLVVSDKAVGNYTLTIRAKGSGVTDATATLTLTVAAASSSTFSIALAPAALSVAQGESGTSTVTIGRTGGYAGAVAFTATGLPPGMTASFDPASVTGSSSTLTITAGSNLAAADYAVVVHGNGSAVTEQTATLTVTVTQASAGNQLWTFCPASGIPVWLAFQDGGGAWTPVTGMANAYEFDITSGKGAVAWVVGSGTEYALTVQYGTTQELTQLGSALCASGTGTKMVLGTVAGLGAAEQAFITFGGASTVLFGGQSAFTLQDVLDGARDLIAGRMAIGVNGSTVTYTMNAGAILRGINPPNGSTINLDFAGAQAFTPVMHGLTINNLGADAGQVTASYITAGGSTGALYTDGGGSTSAIRQFAGVPASAQQAGDLHQLTVSAFGMGGTPTTFRTVSKLFGAAADQTLTLGPDIGAVGMTVAATAPYVRPRAQYTVQPEYNRFWSAGWSQSANGFSRSAILMVSAGYMGSGTAFDFAIPDFSALAGWDNLWGFVTGSDLGWTFLGAGWSQAGGYGGVPNLEGATSLAATRYGTILP